MGNDIRAVGVAKLKMTRYVFVTSKIIERNEEMWEIVGAYVYGTVEQIKRTIGARVRGIRLLIAVALIANAISKMECVDLILAER